MSIATAGPDQRRGLLHFGSDWRPPHFQCGESPAIPSESNQRHHGRYHSTPIELTPVSDGSLPDLNTSIFSGENENSCKRAALYKAVNAAMAALFNACPFQRAERQII